MTRHNPIVSLAITVLSGDFRTSTLARTLTGLWAEAYGQGKIDGEKAAGEELFVSHAQIEEMLASEELGALDAFGRKACPFCGGAGMLMSVKERRFIECFRCGARGAPSSSEAAARERWNKRAK